MSVYFFPFSLRFDSAGINSSDKAKQGLEYEEEMRAREEERQEREEARKAREEEKKAREEERKFREEQRALMKPCECPTKPSVPSIRDAPGKADANMQELLKQTMKRLNIAPCHAGYEFIKTATGYQCRGGGHRVTFAQLGMK
jgi:regulator of protease activity HflC (stomatin/prohibitin superfamily)